MHRDLPARLRGIDAVLEIGGDNYSLDYEPPRHLLAMDRFIQEQGKPVVIWGASIGPFDRDPEFAKEMFDHLRSLSGIFVRETYSLDYLRKNGVSDNVQLVADPAFLMATTEVSAQQLGFKLPSGAIGINFSPFVAKYLLRRKVPLWELTLGDIEPWLALASELITRVSKEFHVPIVLVPHASSDVPIRRDGRSPGIGRGSASSRIAHTGSRLLPSPGTPCPATEVGHFQVPGLRGRPDPLHDRSAFRWGADPEHRLQHEGARDQSRPLRFAGASARVIPLGRG